MSILDFEDHIKVVYESGLTITAQFQGDAEILSFPANNLGHDETALAYQRWVRTLLITAIEVPESRNCTLIFSDGSKRSGSINRRGFDGVKFTYGINFN